MYRCKKLKTIPTFSDTLKIHVKITLISIYDCGCFSIKIKRLQFNLVDHCATDKVIARITTRGYEDSKVGMNIPRVCNGQ